uniref:Putative secreted protein n=1 Tax=Anopheles darlingi TaxID=43151 RepID=A0A2M4DBE3_ANODA
MFQHRLQLRERIITIITSVLIHFLRPVTHGVYSLCLLLIELNSIHYPLATMSVLLLMQFQLIVCAELQQTIGTLEQNGMRFAVPNIAPLVCETLGTNIADELGLGAR